MSQSFVGFLVGLAVLTAVAGEALAVPVSEPLYLNPGDHGLVITYQYRGGLGNTGISVEAMPTMLQIKGVAPGSPAALADLPSPDRYRVRLAAVNGQAVVDMSLQQLLQAFNPRQGEVRVTVARKGPQDLVEELKGPYTLPLSTQAIAHRQADWLLAQRRYAEARAYLEDRQVDTAVLADRLLMAAYDAAAGGDHTLAMTLTAGIARSNPLYERAQALRKSSYEARQNDLLAEADQLAAQGHFPAALGLIKAMSNEGSWGQLRRTREADWRKAIAAKQAHKRVPRDSSLRRGTRRRP